MLDFNHELNPEQLEAVKATEGFVRAIAGPGSGKTRTLAYRFAYLASYLGVPPGNICCVTFTNKAANEMKLRIRRLIGEMDTGYVSTFHGLCVSILQEDGHIIHYPKQFKVLDESDARDILKIVYDENGFTSRDMTYREAEVGVIDYFKTHCVSEAVHLMTTLSVEEVRDLYIRTESVPQKILYGYFYQQRKCFGLDFVDLIVLATHILETDGEARLKWQKRFQYIMVDEFQDIDDSQYRLMSILCGHHGNLFVVGDPDQTIYSWRGARVEYLLDFDKAFPDVRTVILSKNYRSVPSVLRTADSIIKNNKFRIEKELVPTVEGDSPVYCSYEATDRDEAAFIAGTVQKLHDSGVPYEDMAILYRAHYVSRNIEEVFLEKKLPYRLYSGTPFYERKEVKDTLAYLSLVLYRDDLSFLRVCNVPKRNIGRRRVEFLQKYAEEKGCSLYDALRENMDHTLFPATGAEGLVALVEDLRGAAATSPVSEIMTEVLDRSGLEEMYRVEGNQDRLDNLAELKRTVYEFEIGSGEETTLEQYLAHVALLTENDQPDAGGKVKMMTIHAAKGLEFPYVFLCAMSEGILPSKKCRRPEDIEEERRLTFVAVTRAEKGLFLSTAEGRNYDGSFRWPSRFLLEVDESLLETVRPPREEIVGRAREAIRAMENLMEAKLPEFAEGDRVVHEVWGPGEVVRTDLERSAYDIQFDGMGTIRSVTFVAAKEMLKKE